jgi:DNA-binding NtrC family response regulator
MSYNILVVDDEASERSRVETILHDGLHYQTTSVKNGKEAIDLLTSKNDDIDLVLLDLSMPDMDGIDVLRAVKPIKPNLPIIVRTGNDDLDMAVIALKAGATDFVKKMDSADRLQTSVSNALRAHVLHDELDRIKRLSPSHVPFSAIIGGSRSLQNAVSLAERAAISDAPVLIEGESGVGKELIARAIHSASSRAGKPFIVFSCLSEKMEMLETVLFGKECKEGFQAFGKFREAEGGTLLLDDIEYLPDRLQSALLSALQENLIKPVQADSPVKINVRCIATTTQNLASLVERGNFRQDLYYRLNVLPISMPALRTRSGDILALVKHYATRFGDLEGKPIDEIEEDALKLLQRYDWPGNVRQLKNALFRAVILADGHTLHIGDFTHLREAPRNIAKPNSFSERKKSNAEKNILHVAIVDEAGKIRPFAELEEEIIRQTINLHKGHMSDVARQLGIGRSTLYRKMNEMGIPLKFSHNNEGDSTHA